MTPTNNKASQSNHGPLDDWALEHWDGWGEFFLIGKFAPSLGPTLVKMYRAEVKLTSSLLTHCAMCGEYGEAENWGKWTPTLEEQENMLIEAELLADEEEAAADVAFP